MSFEYLVLTQPVIEWLCRDAEFQRNRRLDRFKRSRGRFSFPDKKSLRSSSKPHLCAASMAAGPSFVWLPCNFGLNRLPLSLEAAEGIGKGEPPKAGKTVGFPRGCDSGERSEREGAARSLRSMGSTSAKRVNTPLAGAIFLLIINNPQLVHIHGIKNLLENY
mgnify:CR=1 FL=1